MLEFIEGLIVGVFVTILTIFAVRWNKNVKKAHDTSYISSQYRPLQLDERVSRRPELGVSPSDLKNSEGVIEL